MKNIFNQVLTKEQTRFFNSCKLTDNMGRLKVFYHGDKFSSRDAFHCEQGPVYFSEVPTYAKEYAINTEDDSEGGFFSVYLNMKNPLWNVTDELIRGLDELGIEHSHLLKGQLISTFYIDKDNQVFELYHWLRNNTDYDGIVLTEELTSNHKAIYSDLADLSYVPFYNNQIKSIDNLNPTKSSNIFS